MAQTRKFIIHLILIVIMAGVLEVFSLLSLAFFRANLSKIGYYLILASVTLFNLIACGLELFFYLKNKQIIYKSIITGYVCLIFFLVMFFILLKTGFLEIVKDVEALEEYLENAGVWMGLVFVLLQFFQVVILPIPSFVTVAAGTALFGPLKCALFSLTGIFLGSVTAFLIGRYLGSRAVGWLIGKETLDKWMKKIKGKDKLFLSAMFLLPVFPDDVLCFVAGLSSMSLPFFLAVIGVSRVVAIFTTCYSVTLIPFDTWWGIMLWVLFFVAVAILFVILYKKSDAITAWIEKKLHRETRVKSAKKKGEFTVEIVDPNGAIVEKGVRKDASKNPDDE